MKKSIIFPLAAALMLGGLLLLTQTLTKTIYLEVNGQRRTLTTKALAVGALLTDTGIILHPADQLIPAANTWLHNNQTIRLQQAINIYITADGQEQNLFTAERIPANILTSVGVNLYPGDEILVDGLLTPADQPLLPNSSHSLQVVRAKMIVLNDGDNTYHITTTAPTVGTALAAKGWALRAADYFELSPETPLTNGLQVFLRRSKELTIHLGEHTITALSAAPTIGSALAEIGFPLQGLDYSNPPADAPLPDNGYVEIVQVHEDILLEQKPLAFETQYQPQSDVEIDQQVIVQPGAYGLTVQRVRIRYENGEEVARQVESEGTAIQPQPRIIGYGTKIVVRSIQTSAGTLEYWRAVNMYATSYSPCNLGIPNYCNNQTYSGAPVKKGVAAVIRSWYPSMGGRQVYVPGYGVATILDIGGGIAGRHWIDLGYLDNNYVSWHQWVTVYFLTPVPPPDQILWILP
ncbi:MAG: ubiquitin-like domain-containing protein [Chloroflexota bacterium]